MRKVGWATIAMVAMLVGCAAAPGTEGQGQTYEASEPRTGSNIVSREKRAPTTPEERDRARAQAEAIRASQNPAGMPRPEAMPRGK
jgi:hypothetical protein